MRKFELISEQNKKNKNEVKLPKRADMGSAGYDFYSPDRFVCKPHEITKIWSDIKVYMQNTEFLLLTVRSSMAGKFHLANTMGIIDSTYYNNKHNEGNVGIFLVNDTDEDIIIEKNDRIAQGIFMNYLTVTDDNPSCRPRSGGFGSSGK